jgi:hypothetical protein
MIHQVGWRGRVKGREVRNPCRDVAQRLRREPVDGLLLVGKAMVSRLRSETRPVALPAELSHVRKGVGRSGLLRHRLRTLAVV